MSEHDHDGARISAHPWALYQADHLGKLRAKDHTAGLFSWWLREDLSNKHFAYEVTFVPSGVSFDTGADVLFALLDDFNQHEYDRDPTDVVFSFLDRVLEDSAEVGEVLVELHQPSPGRERRPSRRNPELGVGVRSLPALGYIPPWSLINRRRGALQFAPTEGAPAVFVPETQLRHLELSSSTLSAWQQATRALRQIDRRKVLGDGAGMRRLGWEGYVFKEHAEAENLAVAQATAGIGWDARGTFGSHVTPHHNAYRQLVFTAFWRAVIDDVVAFLNGFTTDVRLYGDRAFSFELVGLPSDGQLKDAMKSVRAGTMRLTDINNALLSPRFAGRRS